MRLAVIYNTCGLRQDSPVHYINSLNSILDQNYQCKVIMSSCMNSDECLKYIKNVYGDEILINSIKDKLPVNVTFNHSCLLARDMFGEFDGYLYIDSGVKLNTYDDISDLVALSEGGEYGIVAAQADSDHGYEDWFGDLKITKDYVIPIGKTVNSHCQIYHRKLLDYYGYILPDIYASHCTESVFSYLCAALGLRFVLSKDVVVNHATGVDGQSAGFDPGEWCRKGGQTYEHPFFVRSVVELAKLGQQYGFGYEECRGIVNHDPNKFTDGLSNDPHLKEFIRYSQFIGNMGFDYKSIRNEVL